MVSSLVASTSMAPTPTLLPSSASLHHRLKSRNMATIYSFDCYTESWIEVSSQPSSSSLSSVADDNHSNALRVQVDQHGRRRRRLLRNEPLPPGLPVRRVSATGSSQEEYEASESESDRNMASSNENVEAQLSEGISPVAHTSSASEEVSSNNAEDEDDDENATALGMLRTDPAFTPQPNAFSHPPQSNAAHRARSRETRTSYPFAQRPSPHRRSAAHSYPSRGSRTTHSPYNMISPSHQADQDAALRASLSTLLSCAAAARGLPKRTNNNAQRSTDNRMSNSVEPSKLRLVPESALTEEEKPPQLPPRPSVRHRSSATSLSGDEKGKRKASSSKERRSKKRRANSPNRDASLAHVQPTLMTWVFSAGVVVLFSAISFSAGYVVGKEMGRLEHGTFSDKDTLSCGKEVGRGLRRLRWGASSVNVVRV